MLHKKIQPRKAEKTVRDQNLMQVILITLLLVCGYLFTLQIACGSRTDESRRPLIAVSLLILYAAIVGGLMLVLHQMGGGLTMMLMASILLAVASMIVLAASNLKNYWHEMNKGMLSLFAVYFLAVIYATLFSRESGKTAEILLRFEALQKAAAEKSVEPLNHFLLNVALFVPMGVLLPLILPERLGKCLSVVSVGLCLSTLVEGTQLLFRLGQCDVEDLVANTGGSLLGYAAFWVFCRVHGAEKSR